MLTLTSVANRKLAKFTRRRGVAAAIAAGTEAHGDYPSTTSGAQTILASAAVDRVVLIVVQVTEAFADAGGTQPVFILGQTSSTNKFMINSVLASASLHAKKVIVGTLSSGTALLATGTAGVGAGTGAISVTAY